MKAALVIVDLQDVLIPVVWQGEELVERIAGLARRARARGVPVVALQQISESGGMFDPEKPGTRVAERVRVLADAVIQKTATDGFYGSALTEFLENVDTVVVAGVATDYCVDATVRAAVSRGFDVVLVEDGHAPARQGDPEAGLSPEQIIARHNRILSAAVHPGGTVKVRSSAKIFI